MKVGVGVELAESRTARVGETGMKSETEQPLFAADFDDRADVEKWRRVDRAVLQESFGRLARR